MSLDQVVAELKKPTGDRFFAKLSSGEFELVAYDCEKCNHPQVRLEGENLEKLGTAERTGILRRFLLSNQALRIGAGVTVIMGFLLSLRMHAFSWFARSGAIVVAVGIMLLSRHILLGVNLKPDIFFPKTGLSQADPRHYKRLGIAVPVRIQQDYDLKVSIGWLGPAVSFVGTVIWGFGDLLNLIIKFN